MKKLSLNEKEISLIKDSLLKNATKSNDSGDMEKTSEILSLIRKVNLL